MIGTTDSRMNQTGDPDPLAVRFHDGLASIETEAGTVPVVHVGSPVTVEDVLLVEWVDATAVVGNRKNRIVLVTAHEDGD